MKDLIEKPVPVIEAAEKQKGLNLILEILVFVAVYIVSSLAQMIILTIGQVIMFSADSNYQKAILEGGADKAMEVAEKIMETDSYFILMLFSDIAMIIVVVFFCQVIQKRNMHSMGFCRTHIFKEYITGMAEGFLFFTAAVLLSVLTGGLSIKGLSAKFSIVVFIFYVLGYMVQGMAEEVLCRGYMLVSVGRRYSMVVAVLANSLFFAALHLANNGITVLAFINLVLFGVFASLYFIRRGNIWGIAAFHSVWNLVQGNFYGISVSGMDSGCSVVETVSNSGKDLLNGGAFGLEGSIFVTIVYLAGIVFLYLGKNHNKQKVVLQK